ncbi:MAG: DUF4440 domain-containing protein [Ideonella sp. MAG2]|nr:MAG: DUF4440 domain-containing protein [Ideonella sp. MAG2]
MSESLAQFFIDLERRRTQALVARDMAVVERLHAPGYELITPAGVVFSRERYLAALAEGPFYTAWEMGEVRVQATAEMAVLRYQARLHFPSGKVVHCWHTDTYALLSGSSAHPGDWQALWSQATAIAAPTPSSS